MIKFAVIIMTYLGLLGSSDMKNTIDTPASSLKKEFIEIAMRYQKDRNLADKLWLEIDSIYTEKRRAYHNMEHLLNFHKQLLLAKNYIQAYEVAFMGMIYHDIVYFTTDGTNETKSAEWANNRLQTLGFPSQSIKKCHAFIMATKGHQSSEDMDINYFIDADMSILGLDPEYYDAYAKGIIAEYGDSPSFRQGRKRFLENFLKRERLFLTDFFQNLYEEQARKNIQREIDNLG